LIPFQQFRSEVKRIAAPESLGENLNDYFNSAVVNGLISVQTFIECYRDYHVDFYGKDAVTDFCGADILNGPRGIVTSVFAYKPGTECTKRFYDRRSTEFIECRIEESRCANCTTNPATPWTLYTYPYCDVPAYGPDACNSVYVGHPEDDTCFKYSDRWYAIGSDYRFYLYPRFPCGYILGVQWQGIKRTYRNTDGVFCDDDLRFAIAKYAEAELAAKDNEWDRHHQLMGNAAVPTPGTFRGLLRDMRHRCQQERRIREPKDCTMMIDSLLPIIAPAYIPGSTPPAVVCA
jgi:hypothetical protein